MASTSGKSIEQLRADKARMEAEGKTASTSKSLGKVIDAIKVLEPEKFGSETVASAQAKLANSTEPIQSAGGSSSPFGGDGSSSGFDVQGVYDQAFQTPEISELKAEIDTRAEARDTQLAKINDNPFYSEATRVGRASKVNQEASNDLTRLNNQLAVLQSEAESKVNIAFKQYDINRQEYQDQLSRLDVLLSSGALANASEADIAGLASGTGFTVNQIRSIINQANQPQIDSQVVTATDNAGNVTVAVIDKNTGRVISQNGLGSIGKASGGGVGSDKLTTQQIASMAAESMNEFRGGDKKVSQQTYLAARQTAASLGMEASEFDQLFAADYVNRTHLDDYGIVDENTYIALGGTPRKNNTFVNYYGNQ